MVTTCLVIVQREMESSNGELCENIISSRLEAGPSRLCKPFGQEHFLALLVGDTFRMTLKVMQQAEDRAESRTAETLLKGLLSPGNTYFHLNCVIAGME